MKITSLREGVLHRGVPCSECPLLVKSVHLHEYWRKMLGFNWFIEGVSLPIRPGYSSLA